jgi:two-component system chemotaxis response regulator CheB
MTQIEMLVIGGSAGCLPVLNKILAAIPPALNIAIIVVIHRMKNVPSEMDKLLSFHSPEKKVVEPEDKEAIKTDCIYLAPQNYHLLVEADRTFSLDYSEAVHYSRPSIDVTFESVAEIYGEQVLAILLSGANCDGTKGVRKIIERGGSVIVQHPDTAEYSFMPKSVTDQKLAAQVLQPHEITEYLHTLV